MAMKISPAVPALKDAGQKTITTAGTSVLLSANTIADEVTIKALSTNVGSVWVKPNGVAGANYQTTGFELRPGEVVTSELRSNLNEIALDTSTNGNIVCFIYVAHEGR